MTTRVYRANGGGRLFAATQEKDAAKWSMLFPRGEWHGDNLEPIGGSITLDDALLREMVANWKAQHAPSLPVYFHHPPPIDEVPPEKRKEVFRAAGHIEDLRVTAEGLEARIKWSAEGQQAVDNDEYRFISPEWVPAHADRHTGDVKGWIVTGAALTDSPFFNEMPRVAAAVSSPTHHPESGPAPQEQKHMDKKLICAALELPDTSTDDAVMAAIKSLFTKTKAATEAEEKLTAAVGELETLKAAAGDKSATVTKLEARIVSLENEVVTRDAEKLAAKLIADRRCLPAHKDAIVKMARASGIKETENFFGAFPVSPVHQGEQGSNIPAPGNTGTEGGAPDMKALQAKHDEAVDAKVKAGASVLSATREVKRLPEFRPLYAAQAKSTTRPSANTED